MEFYNGDYWEVTHRDEIAKKMLTNLVKGIDQKFGEYPKNDEHIINIYPKYVEYCDDKIGDEKTEVEHVKKISDNLVNLTRSMGK